MTSNQILWWLAAGVVLVLASVFVRIYTAGKYEIKLHGALERSRFDFSDFTDIRDGSKYSYDATIVQVFVSATF